MTCYLLGTSPGDNQGKNECEIKSFDLSHCKVNIGHTKMNQALETFGFLCWLKWTIM